MTDDSRILTISDAALAKVLVIVDAEGADEELALVLAIAGAEGTEFTYSMHMTPINRLDEDDTVERHGDLVVAFPIGSVENLRGATLEMSKNLLQPGLSIENPNSPSPEIIGDGPPPDLSGPVAEQVDHVLRTQINPSIAAHGGVAELVAVEDGIAYVRLGGACQGCGLADVTLSQGIETTIVSTVPEVHKVIDVTDHNQGDNPYYEQSKK
jgi:Fe/S biogenesis protein NfuA